MEVVKGPNVLKGPKFEPTNLNIQSTRDIITPVGI